MSSLDTLSVVEKIKQLLPKRRPIDHHETFANVIRYDPNAADYVNGPHNFRYRLEKVTGADHIICTSSGTAALHVALMALGIRHGDRVILPSATFVATANAVSYVGAIPYFLDGGLMDPDALRDYIKALDTKIAAIIPVHLLGHAVDMPKIMDIAYEFNIPVIEDAAQALGTTINGKQVGIFGDVGILSFNNNKILTTHGGGALLTNNPWVYEKALKLATTARLPHPWKIEHDAIGWNYRMGNINAAFGMPQLFKFAEILRVKKHLAGRYRQALEGVEFFEPVVEGSSSNYWLNTIMVDSAEELLGALHAEGIRARAMFTPMHKLPMYKMRPRSSLNMPQSEELFRRAVCLPSGHMI